MFSSLTGLFSTLMEFPDFPSCNSISVYWCLIKFTFKSSLDSLPCKCCCVSSHLVSYFQHEKLAFFCLVVGLDLITQMSCLPSLDVFFMFCKSTDSNCILTKSVREINLLRACLPVNIFNSTCTVHSWYELSA